MKIGLAHGGPGAGGASAHASRDRRTRRAPRLQHALGARAHRPVRSLPRIEVSVLGGRGLRRSQHHRLDGPLRGPTHAACTSAIRLATGICLVPEHNPLALAKTIASLDRVSGGRFALGVGIGWAAEEFKALGIPFARRARRTREYIAVMQKLCGEESTTFHGEFVDVEVVRSFPSRRRAAGCRSSSGARARRRSREWQSAAPDGSASASLPRRPRPRSSSSEVSCASAGARRRRRDHHLALSPERRARQPRRLPCGGRRRDCPAPAHPRRRGEAPGRAGADGARLGRAGSPTRLTTSEAFDREPDER